jgi:hypothetical protein
MSEHSQTVFLIERIQPSWLETKDKKWMKFPRYDIIVSLIVGPSFVAFSFILLLVPLFVKSLLQMSFDWQGFRDMVCHLGPFVIWLISWPIVWPIFRVILRRISINWRSAILQSPTPIFLISMFYLGPLFVANIFIF